jgi:hypothetical protein
MSNLSLMIGYGFKDGSNILFVPFELSMPCCYGIPPNTFRVRSSLAATIGHGGARRLQQVAVKLESKLGAGGCEAQGDGGGGVARGRGRQRATTSA